MEVTRENLQKYSITHFAALCKTTAASRVVLVKAFLSVNVDKQYATAIIIVVVN